MKSVWQSWIQIIVLFISWWISSGFGFLLRRHMPPLLPIRPARTPKYYYLLVKAIPQLRLPDYSVYRNQHFRDYLIYGVNPEPVAMNPFLSEVAAFLNEEAIIHHYTITRHITHIKRGTHLYSNHISQPMGYRYKRGPTRGMFGLDNHDFVLTALSQGDMDSDFSKLRSRTGRRRHRVKEPPPNVPLPGRMSVGQGSSSQPDTKFLHRRILELRQRQRMLETRERMLEMLSAGKRKR